MDRSATAYLLLHYLVLLILIFGIVAVIDRFVDGIPLVVGIGIAVVVGLAYPRVMVATRMAPEQWRA